MSVDQTDASALARQLQQVQLREQDEKLQKNLHKLHQSQQHSFLPWKHLSAAHLTQLASLSSASERRGVLSTMLGLDARFPLGQQAALRRDEQASAAQKRAQAQAEKTEQDTNLTRREIIIDLALALLGFCWTHELSALKTSTFFSILYTVHQTVAEGWGGVGGLGGPAPTMSATANLFDSLLLKHSLERPPFSICCFSAPDVALLSDYFSRTYLRHLRLYQFVFGTRNELELRVTNSEAECVDRDFVGVPELPRPTDGLEQFEPPREESAAVPPPPGSAASPASAAPATAAAGAAPVAAAPAPSTWWNLDHARSYFPHSNSGSGAGAASWGTLPLSSASGLLNLESANGGQQGGTDGDDDDDEFKDSASVADYLEAQAAAAEALALRVASGGSASDVGEGPLLASPEDQALFERAMARELGSLTRDFHAQLRGQQEAFAKRLAELDLAAAAANGAGASDASAANSGRARIGSADKGRKGARGKV